MTKLTKEQLSEINQVIGSYEALDETIAGLEKGWTPSITVNNDEDYREWGAVSLDPVLARDALVAQRERLAVKLSDLGVEIEV